MLTFVASKLQHMALYFTGYQKMAFEIILNHPTPVSPVLSPSIDRPPVATSRSYRTIPWLYLKYILKHSLSVKKTQMYGQYQRDLGEFARRQAVKLKQRDQKYKKRKEEPPGGFQFYAGKTFGKIQKFKSEYMISYTSSYTHLKRFTYSYVYIE